MGPKELTRIVLCTTNGSDSFQSLGTRLSIHINGVELVYTVSGKQEEPVSRCDVFAQTGTLQGCEQQGNRLTSDMSCMHVFSQKTLV